MPAILLISIFLIIPALNASADTVLLKNGRKIEGIIVKEDSNCLELEVNSGTIKFDRKAVDRINKDVPGQDLLRQKWQQKKARLEEKISAQKLEEENKPRDAGFLQSAQGIVLDATLNKKTDVKLLLDTGASLVMISAETAKKLGIDPARARPDMVVKVADGRNIRAKSVILKSVKVQSAEADNVEAVFLLDEAGSLGNADGLLGMSFLKRFNFKIDHKENKLILEKL